MKTILLLFFIILSAVCYSQINSFPYYQTFSNVNPSDFTYDAGWNLTNNDNSRTGSYSAKLSPAINGNTKYIYIAVSVTEDNIYTLSLWTKKICSLTLSTNETPDQTSLLVSETNNVNGCNGKSWKETTLIYVPNYTGIMYFQILVTTISEDMVYIDDITISESQPSALPIELLYFKGYYEDGYNILKWVTASEFNNDYFIIDKTKDGYYFYEVCKIKAIGNSNYFVPYEVIDYVDFNGIIYYRLKQVDYDGKINNFDLISIDNREKSIPKLIKVIDLLGREMNDLIGKKGLFLFYYDDGKIIKKFIY